jgi:cupin fold WbuC family metalloprotein
MRTIDQKLLDDLSAQAAANPRLRKNHNLHPADDFCCHRLFNAVEPGSYIRPHRHLDPVKDETFVIVRGRLGVVEFDDNGNVVGTALLEAGGETVAADVPHGAFHAAVSLEAGTIFFEAKAGPYIPLADLEKASWAPDEGVPEATAYLASLEQLFR